MIREARGRGDGISSPSCRPSPAPAASSVAREPVMTARCSTPMSARRPLRATRLAAQPPARAPREEPARVACKESASSWRGGRAARPPEPGRFTWTLPCAASFARHRSGGSGGVPARLQGLCKFDGRRDRRLVRRARRCASGMPALVVMVSPLLPGSTARTCPWRHPQLVHPLVQIDRARARRWSPSRSGGQCDHRSNAAVGERCRGDAAQAVGCPMRRSARRRSSGAGAVHPHPRRRATSVPDVCGARRAGRVRGGDRVRICRTRCRRTRRTRSTHVWTCGLKNNSMQSMPARTGKPSR